MSGRRCAPPRRLATALGLALAAAGATACEGGGEPAPAQDEAAGSDRAPGLEGWVRAHAPAGGVLFEGPGRVVPTPGAVAHVSVPFDVRVVAVHVAAGDRVEAGAELVDVAPPEVLRAAAALGPAAARVRALERRIEVLRGLRAQELVEAGRLFALETQLAEARGALGDARATLAAAGVRPGRAGGLVARGRLPLAAPIAGVVREVRAIEGHVLPAGGPALIEIVGEGAARIEGRFAGVLPDDDVPGLSAEFDPGVGEPAPLAWPPRGRTRAPDDGTWLAFFDAEAAGGALPAGLTGVVRLRSADPGATAGHVVEVPAAAVVLRGGTPHVVVDLGGDRGPTPLPVEVAAIDGERALVRGDLGAGERVAVDPARLLDLGEAGGGEAAALDGPSGEGSGDPAAGGAAEGDAP